VEYSPALPQPLERALAASASRRVCEPMPNPSRIVRYSLEILAIAVPLAAMTYFLFDPDAFNAFLDWLVRVL
jgi:hypothetical protein